MCGKANIQVIIKYLLSSLELFQIEWSNFSPSILFPQFGFWCFQHDQEYWVSYSILTLTCIGFRVFCLRSRYCLFLLWPASVYSKFIRVQKWVSKCKSLFLRSPKEMNYYAVEVFQNIYVYIGHSFHHMAIIIIVLSVKIIAIPRRTDYVNVGTGEHSCNETGASSVLSFYYYYRTKKY